MQGKLEYSVAKFAESLEASFIGSGKEPDERYSPRILGNDDQGSANVLSTLKAELADCASFSFSVAFITASGMQVLAGILADLRDRGVPGRILTSTYLNFNNPDALRKLGEYPNIEARVYQGDLHAKGYFFSKDQISTIIIGSSNLTQKALTCNKEWNILFRSFPNGQMLLEAKAEYDKLWNDADTKPLTSGWIDEYEAFLARETRSMVGTPKVEPFRLEDVEGATPAGEGALPAVEGSPASEGATLGGARPTSGDRSVGSPRFPRIKPNKMQESALEALAVLHGRREPRALLVSATGTGKTYLSALDVERQRPRTVLFIAHRQRILSASRESFECVLGAAYTYDLYQGANRSQAATCLFAMVGTLARHLCDFAPDAFDYIVIDEAHRTGAAGYRQVLDYFKPRFVLGMTATPSRTDGYDVYSLFNHVIAYRITLQDALSNEMLAPFHYFGIADLEIDDEQQDDLLLFSKLTSEARVEHVVRKIEEYTVQKSCRRGLVFCSRNDEAAYFAKAFCERGLPSKAISGASSAEERDCAIRELERGAIDYIFSVDIMNEGVDIPSLNQIIMLRRTESAIVFVQQLGRGLRKCDGKEFALVLDFIGNYQQNYLVPIALSGDRTYNKDTLRKVVKEGSSAIPGCSTITFDRISEKRIFKALEEGCFSDVRLIKAEYEHLRQLLGRIPHLVDFDENEAIDPLIIIKKFGSYAAFLQKHEKSAPGTLSERKLAFLKFISTKLASGKRRADLEVLARLLSRGAPVSLRAVESRFGCEQAHAVSRMLSGSFSTLGQELVVTDEGQMCLGAAFSSALSDPYFRECVLDTVRFGLARADRNFADCYKDTGFVLYEKYSREDVAIILNWEKEPNYQNVGRYFHDAKTNTFPVFIDYEKDPSISATIQYEDRFITDRRIIAISKNNRSLESPEIVRLAHERENGMKCYLFVRKNKNDKDSGKEFYFLGQMHPTGDFVATTMEDGKTNVVEITYALEQPVRADLYDYLTSNLDG